MNRRVVSLVLLAVMLLCFTACGKKNTPAETAAPAASSAPVTDNTSGNNQPGTSDETTENSSAGEPAGEVTKPQTPESAVAPIPEENVTIGVTEGAGEVIEENASSTAPENTSTIVTPAVGDSGLDIDLASFDITTLTYEMYNAMSAEQQRAIIDMFGSPDDFMRWYKAVEAKYKEEHPDMEIGSDGTVNLG